MKYKRRCNLITILLCTACLLSACGGRRDALPPAAPSEKVQPEKPNAPEEPAADETIRIYGAEELQALAAEQFGEKAKEIETFDTPFSQNGIRAFFAAVDGYSDGYLETEKPYYFFYDGERFVEYGGVRLSKRELFKIPHARDIVTVVEQDDTYVTDIWYRSNGIININLKVQVSGGVYQNSNITLIPEEDGSVRLAMTAYTDQLVTTDYHGVYEDAITEDALFPTEDELRKRFYRAEDIWDCFLEDVLIPKHGEIKEYDFRRPFKTEHADAGGYSFIVESDYELPQGILCTCVHDLDRDGTEELLVVYRNSKTVWCNAVKEGAQKIVYRMEIYEEDDPDHPAEIILDEGVTDAQPWSDRTNAIISFKENADETIVCMSVAMGPPIWADGDVYILRGFRYRDGVAEQVAEACFEGSIMDDGIPEEFLAAAEAMELTETMAYWKTFYAEHDYVPLLVEEGQETTTLVEAYTRANLDDKLWEIADTDNIDEEALSRYGITGVLGIHPHCMD